MTLLQDGVTWFADRAKENAGRTVTYTRGGGSSGILTAWVKEDKEDLINGMGFPIKTQIRSYKCLLADLPVTDPRSGDLIKETINGTVYEFEVRPPDDDTDAVEWLDGDGVIRIIHTGIYKIG